MEIINPPDKMTLKEMKKIDFLLAKKIEKLHAPSYDNNLSFCWIV